MYILFTGFSPSEQKIIESWSKNIAPDLSEGFSVGNSLQIGRLVEIKKEFLKDNDISLKDLIDKTRELREDYEDYLSFLIETRFFYNEKIDCIFTTGITETEMGLAVKITRIPFPIFFKMADSQLLKAYIGYEEEGEIVPDNEIELVEVGFLSRYLICHFIDDNSVFLIEAKDIKEFQKISQFIVNLGNRIGWKWYKRESNENIEGEGNNEENVK